METKSDKQKEKSRILLMTLLVVGCCLLMYFFHKIFEVGSVFTHFFYIPIVLASLWWKRNGLVVAVFLSALLIFSHYLLRDHVETNNDYFRSLMFVIVGFTVSILSIKIDKAREKISHLNAILSAIRNVNQLIAIEKDRDRLLKGACNHLIEPGAYHTARIAIFDKNEKLVKTAEAGLGKNFLPIAEKLKRGELPGCDKRALTKSSVILTKAPLPDCTDCPLSAVCNGRVSISIRLEHRGKVYGLLSVSISIEFAENEEEKNLFSEVAGDIAFALYSIKLQEEHEQAEEELRYYRLHLEEIVEEKTIELKTANRQLKKEIAEREKAEEQLKKGKSILQASFDGISEPLIMFGKDLSVRILNIAAMKYYKANELETIIGRPCFEAFSKNTDFCEGCEISSAIQSVRERIFEQKCFVSPDRFVQVAVYPFKKKEVGMDGAIVRITDITEKNQIQEQLVRADRLSSLGQLSGGIAHEIKNPLTGIRLFTDLLSEKYKIKLGDHGAELLDEIKSNVDSIDGIIKRVLDFAKQPAESFKKIDINSIIRENLKLWSAKLRKSSIMLKLSLKENLFRIQGDAISIQQLTNNLILNAIEAMNKGGVLEIETFETKSSF
ncbi:MAG: PAS domain-containing protein, partial [Deltaproteobacteria bacterium]|nr:PAS domain-containing protein [Deltaproteobacteria bacterium]